MKNLIRFICLLSFLSLIFFFVVGLIALPFVNEQKAVADVKRFEASATE